MPNLKPIEAPVSAPYVNLVEPFGALLAGHAQKEHQMDSAEEKSEQQRVETTHIAEWLAGELPTKLQAIFVREVEHLLEFPNCPPVGVMDLAVAVNNHCFPTEHLSAADARSKKVQQGRLHVTMPQRQGLDNGRRTSVRGAPTQQNRAANPVVYFVNLALCQAAEYEEGNSFTPTLALRQACGMMATTLCWHQKGQEGGTCPKRADYVQLANIFLGLLAAGHKKPPTTLTD